MCLVLLCGDFIQMSLGNGELPLAIGALESNILPSLQALKGPLKNLLECCGKEISF